MVLRNDEVLVVESYYSTDMYMELLAVVLCKLEYLSR